MNILFCDPLKVRNLGTYSVHIYELLSNLSKLGHNVVAINTDISRNGDKTDIGQQPPLLKQIKNSLGSSLIYKPLKGGVSTVRGILHQIRIFLSAFALMVKRGRKFDVIYRRHNLFCSEYFLAKLFKIPSVKEVNGIIADEARITKRRNSLSLRIIDPLEKFSMPKADKIIVIASKMKEVLHNDYKIPENKIIVVENGANTELFKPMDATETKRELNLSLSDNYICFVGNLIQWQGIEYLIRAMPHILGKCRNTQLLIVGDGQMKRELIELAEQVGISDKVLFTGMVPYQKVPLYVNASDVCTAPFVRERNERAGISPLKLCEYLACEKPVVTSKLVGLEMLEQNGAGILVAPENPQELANAIMKLLQNPELRKQMGRNGRKYVVENRSWESVARRVADICEQTIEEYTGKSKKKKRGKL